MTIATLTLSALIVISGCSDQSRNVAPAAGPTITTKGPTAKATTTDPTQAVCGTAAQLVQNGDSQGALDVIAQLRDKVDAAARACEKERLTAIDALAKDKLTPKTPVEQADSAWSDFSSAYAVPLQSLLTTTIAALVLLLLAARLLVLMPILLPKRCNHRWLKWIHRVGLALLLGVAFGTTFWLPRVKPDSRTGLAVWLTIGGVVGICLVAYAWAAALKLNVVVSTDSGDIDYGAGHVIGLLQELGADEPRGIEALRGTDVEVLSTAGLKAAPTTQPMAALFSLAELLVPRSPWSIRIETENKDSRGEVLSVTIIRNRRYVASAVIDRVELHLTADKGEKESEGDAAAEAPSRTPDLDVMAAAFILTTLARHYSGFDGLYGATDWRSVGLGSIATSPDFVGTPRERELLADAVAFDPANVAAQVALRRALWRKSTQQDGLDLFAEWLKDALEGQVPQEPEWWRPLRLRVLHMWAVACVNSAFANLKEEATEQARKGVMSNRAAMEAAEQLMRELFSRELDKYQAGLLWPYDGSYKLPLQLDMASTPLLEQLMAPSAAAMYCTFHPGKPKHSPPGQFSTDQTDAQWKKASERLLWEAAYSLVTDAGKQRGLSPHAAYSLACYLATKEKPEEDEAVKLLLLAKEVPEIAAWSRKDPQLKFLRQSNQKWRDAFLADAQADFLMVEPFAAYRSKLRSAGVCDPAALAGMPATRLKPLLGVETAVIQYLRTAAEMATQFPPVTATQNWPVELFVELIRRGHPKWPVADNPELFNEIATAMKERLKSAPADGEEIQTYLGLT
jgi:hypothetical protein